MSSSSLDFERDFLKHDKEDQKLEDEVSNIEKEVVNCEEDSTKFKDSKLENKHSSISGLYHSKIKNKFGFKKIFEHNPYKNKLNNNKLQTCSEDVHDLCQEDSIKENIEDQQWKHVQHCKCYYTESETSFLGDLKKLFKSKLIKNRYTSYSKDREKLPEHTCRIKIEAWEKHHDTTCSFEEKEYKKVGEILFPACSKKYFWHGPGMPVKRSKKGSTLNKPEMFGVDECEKRKYACPNLVLPTICCKNMSGEKLSEYEVWEMDDNKELDDNSL